MVRQNCASLPPACDAPALEFEFTQQRMPSPILQQAAKFPSKRSLLPATCTTGNLMAKEAPAKSSVSTSPCDPKRGA